MGFLVRIANKIENTIKKSDNLKIDPKDYSTICGAGSFVPCQMEAYFLAMNKYVKEKDSVLDVGFGLGYGLNVMSIKAAKVSGVDVDKNVYDYCQDTLIGKNPKVDVLKVYDGYNLDFADNTFDIVTCVDVIEHVEDYERLIKEMLRVSKRGLFLSTPNRRPEYTNSDGTPKNYWHLREWSYDEFNTIVKKFGTIDWNCANGEFEGPFKISNSIKDNTLTLSPFINK